MRKLFKVAQEIQEKLSGTAKLSELLAYLRASAHVHQSHHWQTYGPSYYADHLLFQRLYEDSQAFIDQLAERTVLFGSEESVNTVNQVDMIGGFVHEICKNDNGTLSSDGMMERSLYAEELALEKIKEVISGGVTAGTSNLLEGMADKHEEFMYLLNQRRSGNE